MCTLQGIGFWVAPGSSTTATAAEQYRTIFQVNVFAPLRLTEALIANGNLTSGAKIGYTSSFLGSLALTVPGSFGFIAEYRCVPRVLCELCVRESML